MIDSF